jgi:hypothetical protein
VQSQQLLTQSQVYEDELLAGTESADHPPEEMPERHDHGKNLVGTVRIELFAKSYILRVYDVLARHRTAPSLRTTRRLNEPESSVLSAPLGSGLLKSGSTCAPLRTPASANFGYET